MNSQHASQRRWLVFPPAKTGKYQVKKAYLRAGGEPQCQSTTVNIQNPSMAYGPTFIERSPEAKIWMPKEQAIEFSQVSGRLSSKIIKSCRHDIRRKFIKISNFNEYCIIDRSIAFC